MRALVTDLDRTLTGPDLRPDPRCLDRIAHLRERGIRVVIASGRVLDHMLTLGLDRVADALVAEDGAVLRFEGTTTVRAPDFADCARAAMGDLAARFAWGQVLASGLREDAPDAIRRLDAAGIAHHVSSNAEEVMILPPGMDKATGAHLVLPRLGVDPADAWSIGDGENDLPLFRMSRVSAAPAQAPEHVRRAASTRLVSAYSEGFLDFTLPLVQTPAPRAARRLDLRDAPTRPGML